MPYIPALSTHLLLPGSLSEFPFHSFSNDFSNMGIVEYAQDRGTGVHMDRFA